jgi:hypothetical protein
MVRRRGPVVTKTCPGCGSSFEVSPSMADRKVYCQASCRRAAGNGKGKQGPKIGDTNGKGQKFLPCLKCDKLFWTTLNRSICEPCTVKNRDLEAIYHPSALRPPITKWHNGVPMMDDIIPI